MPSISISFVAIALVAATPALADPGKGTQSAAGRDTTSDAKPAAQRYCVEGSSTGTILPTRECHTRAEWLRKGVDPLKPNG